MAELIFCGPNSQMFHEVKWSVSATCQSLLPVAGDWKCVRDTTRVTAGPAPVQLISYSVEGFESNVHVAQYEKPGPYFF